MKFLQTKKEWRDSDNVFAVVFTNLKHAAFDGDKKKNNETKIETIEIEGTTSNPAMAQRNRNSTEKNDDGPTTTYHTVQRGGDSDEDEDAERSLSLLKTLEGKLPYLYLRLHDLDICVENTAKSIY